MSLYPKCRFCKTEAETDYMGIAVCKRCELSLFQMDEILNAYLNEREIPDWIINGAIELGSWPYNTNTRGSGYFHTADEIVSIFAIDKEEIIPIEDIIETRSPVQPEKKILEILKESYIIEYDEAYIYPGKLSNKLIESRWEGLELNDKKFSRHLDEMRGIISISITKNLLVKGSFVPQKALAIFKLLSQILINNEDNEQINPIIYNYDFDIAFVKLPDRYKSRLVREVLGFRDGKSKIVDDVDFDQNILLKREMITYLENIRKRYREREVERNRM